MGVLYMLLEPFGALYASYEVNRSTKITLRILEKWNLMISGR